MIRREENEIMNVLQTIDLKKYYGSGPNITRALDGVNLSVEQGEFVAVVGTSGSGKSTLLNMMGGLDTPTSGSVIVRGDELSQKSDEELTIFRRRNIGFIFQNYNLVPILNVYENIVLPVELDGDVADVLGLLKRTSREFNQTIVMITHNNEIAQLADRIVRIEDGRLRGGQARSASEMSSGEMPLSESKRAFPYIGGDRS